MVSPAKHFYIGKFCIAEYIGECLFLRINDCLMIDGNLLI
jgi:hypothetical protein